MSGPWTIHRAFPDQAMEAITREIRATEASHRGEIVFAVQGSLDLWRLVHGAGARERAIEVFSELRVWDTEHNNGVLIYLLLADHDVEIVADRGFNGRVAAAEWSAVCENMEREFRAGRLAEGVIAGVGAVGRIIGAHYPQRPGQRDEDELPNRPALF